ncbi:response regulator [Neoehrlichia mikurensis]|uniref:histidine kinase n=1 Tax=Neoehrlichia mikurensis TaxID=89586 RepID=A0ABY5F231_9RICK|nr:response regulator [Neoehrlichia mikurensis]QXK92353.1 response regulator [Neoehrlichia mikurensis]QXK93198.1 response regulator [Neoehrlichia mikurensis]QXK94047.1 response regulator [Neoehrlichia mikurensis]UTO56880.1 response regulator [Neoehrlichia mikurensis]
MDKRYIDNVQNKVDFVTRDYGISITRIVILLIFPLLFISSLHLLDIDNKFINIFIHFTISGIAIVLIFKKLSCYLNIIASIEYQNMIFANALNHNTEFCLIIKDDGVVIYSDARFNTRFKNYPQKDKLNVFSILKLCNISDQEIKNFQNALANKSSVQTYFSINKQNSILNFSLILDPIINNPQIDINTNYTFSLSLNPLSRTQEYFVLKAIKVTKEQVYERLIQRHCIGSYVLNSSGVILSTNEIFLKMFELDYLKKGMLFTDLLAKNYLYNNNNNEVFLSTFTGIVFKAYITQSIFYDKNNHSYIYGLITPQKYDFISYQLHPCFADAPIAIVQCDANGKIIKYNKSFQVLTHDENQDYIFSYIEDSYNKKIKKYLENNIINNMSIEAQLCNKAYVKIYFHKFIHNDDIFIICYITDSAERKNLEIQLEQSQKMQAVGQLAGGIAHDFNNILTAIIGFCDLLLVQHPSTDQSFTDIMQIKQNANRATNLIKQLLAFSRKQTLQPKILDVNNIIADLSYMIKRLINENISLQTQYDNNIGLVKADLCQLEQVIINLAVNARAAMELGGTLTIQTFNLKVDSSVTFKDMFSPDKEHAEHGEYVAIKIADTGCGINKQIMKKIFDPFFSTRDPAHNTGLGLSTVYGIIKQTGGYIYVSSKINIGTQFLILLPKIHVTSYDFIQENPKLYNNNTNTIDNKELQFSANILLIEDEDPIRTLTSKALTKKGFNVIDISSGKKALNIIKNNKIHVVISDVVMPEISGPEIILDILKIQQDIKVIFISGYAEEVFNKHKSSDFSKAKFLSKPFTIKQLVETVQEVLTL